MDQAAPAYQSVLLYFRKCCAFADLARGDNLLLVAVIKKRLALKQSLYTILQILSTSIFEKTPILSLFEDVDDLMEESGGTKQLKLF